MKGRNGRGTHFAEVCACADRMNRMNGCLFDTRKERKGEKGKGGSNNHNVIERIDEYMGRMKERIGIEFVRNKNTTDNVE